MRLRMMSMIRMTLLATAAGGGVGPTASSAVAEMLTLDERPAAAEEWGYRPAAGAVSQVSPPSFSWRPQKEVASWEIECARDAEFKSVEYRVKGVTFNVHCPPRVFPAGAYTWRYRGLDAKGAPVTNWSQPRSFSLAPDARPMPLPPRDELLARIPKTHPRLFVRPENMAHLRQLAAGELKKEYQALVAECEKLLKKPPSTKEPPTYPEGMKKGSDEWSRIWWGNRTYTIATLDGAARLAFTRLLGGKAEYGQLAKRILLECAAWDPKGATGYRYNDEAGMPYNYYFSRTYTFAYDLLSEAERATCRKVMKIRGDEMYNHLYPRHLWQPYASHSNRAWHKLGEIGIAFLGEVEGAEDWVWFATNVFFNVYPVWCDDDGGWHEGASYWSSYQSRFSWWADVMREAMGLNAYDKPYFSKAGYYPMYLLPPGKTDGGFGDLSENFAARKAVPLVSVFAAQARNPYWQWYVERMGGPEKTGGYIGFVRGALPKVEAKAPTELPASRLFRGIGQAFLNTDITNAANDVQVIFKSSPFGTQSHGYDANNSFILWAYGQRLLIKTGTRDMYGSEHHAQWMWSTRSVNCITVDGKGQRPHSAASKGEIVAFKTTPSMDLVVGEAGGAYATQTGADAQGKGGQWAPFVNRFTRAILFVKPELIVIYDRLESKTPSTFDYWLHAVKQIEVQDQHQVMVKNGDVVCEIDFLAPAGLTFKQTDQYDPNPRERVKLREWHLRATTPAKAQRTEFVTLYRPHRADKAAPTQAELKPFAGGYVLTAKLSDGGNVVVHLPTSDEPMMSAHGLAKAGVVAQRRRADGSLAGDIGQD